jgi:hypothetical protein
VLLGTATDPENFRARFSDNDNKIREQIAADMKKEDEFLKHYIKSGRLEKWYPGIIEAAKKAVREEANERGEEMGGEVRGSAVADKLDEGTSAKGGKQKAKGKTVKLVVQGRVGGLDEQGDVSMS